MTKPQVLKTLSDSDIEWAKKQKTLRLPGHPPKLGYEEALEKGLSKQQLLNQRRQRRHPIYVKARKEISDLTLLAEYLPEDQLNQIFTEELLLPLFNAIFLGYKALLEPDEEGKLKPVNPDEKLSMNDKSLKKRRKRLLPLCYQVICLLDNLHFSEQLAGQALRSFTALEERQLPGVKAIYYRNMIQEKER